MGIPLRDIIASGIRVPKVATPGIPTPPKRNAPRGTGKVARAKRERCAKWVEAMRDDVRGMARGDHVFSVWIPLKVQTEGKAKGHWRSRYCRKVNQQRLVAQYITPNLIPALPVTVEFTRYGRLLDTDNLVSAFGHVRDAIAKIYGVGDGPNDPIVWAEPRQEYRREMGDHIHVTIRPIRTAAPAAAREDGHGLHV